MEAAIRFNINSLPGQADQNFLKIDVANRILQLYNIKSEGKDGLKYELVHASGKLDSFKAFDWHPREAHLVAVGHDIRGEARLVDLAHPAESAITFNAKNSRPCNAVGLNTQNLFAAGHTRIRSDFCLNVWDLNQRQGGSKKVNEPLHKLAMNEAVTSLRFFYGQPQLLAAGVKEQFVRLYDLRERPSTFALQFATKCVNNIAIDNKDENFFASCLPSNHPTVSIWDRRMVSRNSNPHMGFGAYISQADQHPEPSLELKNLIDAKDSIWGLRFSKTKRGHLGILSSTGQLSYIKFNVGDDFSEVSRKPQEGSWDMQKPKAIFLDDTLNVFRAWNEQSGIQPEHRIVSFDFTTDSSTTSEAKVITLTAHGMVKITRIKKPCSPHVITNYGQIIRGDDLTRSEVTSDKSRILVEKMKLKEGKEQQHSYLQTVHDRCEQSYLLDADINYGIVDSEGLKALWMWLKHAKQISAAKALVQSSVDFSFLGIFAFWMEEVAVRSRASHEFNSGVRISATIKELTRRLGITRGKGCTTEYTQNRALCLHVLGLAYNQADVRVECDGLIQAGEHTKAAATALFAGEEKIAQQALRAKGSGDSHKLLAMALLGARNRHRRMRRMSHGSEKSQSQDDGSEEDGSQDEEWRDIVTAVAEDLTDCYARAILAFVKTGSWEDVISQECLPLRYKIGIALRHFGDSRLTRYLSTLKQEVIQKGDLEGIVITGVGTTEGVHLLQTYATRTNDLQTAALALSYEATSDRYLPPISPEMRIVYVYRETYKKQLMSLQLKHEKARFTVALSRAIREFGVVTELRKREQIRLICTHCNQSTAALGHEQQAMQSAHITETTRHVLSPEKAAVAGVVCPKCGRHLPRCGVCNMWLGTPDESFSKWYRPSPAVDLGASMAGSTVTAIGPGNAPPTISVTKAQKGKGQLSSADLISEPVEVVDEGTTKLHAEKKWYDAMHKFTIFCTICSHAFHAEHAKMWFAGMGGYGQHKTCPVPLCECMCNV